jgi:hypothetical protein
MHAGSPEGVAQKDPLSHHLDAYFRVEVEGYQGPQGLHLGLLHLLIS